MAGSGVLNIKDEGIDQLSQAIERYGAGSGQIIQEVFDGFAANEIKENVVPHIHPSGRTFIDHRTSATRAGIGRVFQHHVNGLTLTVESKGNFGYLFFPDVGQGAHQKRKGAQEFMLAGARDATQQIIDRCLARLAEEF